MKRRTFLGALGGVGALGAGYVGLEVFAPEQATEADEELAESGTTTLKSGEFTGKERHQCSGAIELVEGTDGNSLQFRDYKQTQGPDVFCYLTPAKDPDTASQVNSGTKVLIDGGADGGEITKTGTFAQPVPDDVSVADKQGVAIWCDAFRVPFGAATLEAV